MVHRTFQSVSSPSPATRAAAPVLRLVRPEDPSESAELDFDTLFRCYSGYVATIAFRLTGRDSDVDDLVQEVFLAAHRGLVGLRDPRAVRRWLATVCVRRAARRLRARKLRTFLSLDALAEREEPASVAPGPDACAEAARLFRKLDGLPTTERIVWILRHLEGESLDGISVLCHCSKSTVQRRLRAAQSRLEREMSW